MMGIHRNVDAIEEKNLLPEEIVERCADAGSVKSLDNTESNTTSSSRKWSDTTLDISRDSKSENSDDTPDLSGPVYNSTTEPIEPEDKYANNCGCCSKIRISWRNFKKSIQNFSNRQCRMLIMLCLGTLTSSLSVCLFPPFYPKLAEDKGESVAMYGMVIGTNCLTAFIVTPIIGKNMERIGVNFAFLAGMFGSGICCVMSGFLEYFPSGIKFEVTSFVIRVIHATSNAGVITSTIAFIAGEFPNSVAFLFSMTRATMNLAQMVGPALGGALHNFGGFKMPFFVLGSCQVVVCLICAYYLPEFKGKPKSENGGPKKGVWAVFKVPGIWVSFFTFIFSTMSNGFLSITLEPFVLRQFNISPLGVGLLFGLKDGANCFASPLWGWLCEKIARIKVLIVVGSILAASSFILIGPFPFLPIHQTISIVIFSLILNGFGVGGQQVAGVISAMRDTVDSGFPDEPDTHAFITGLWSSLSGAGRFISRAVSGILVKKIGFQFTSVIVTSLHLAILCVTSIYLCATFPTKKDEKERKKSYQIRVEANSPSEPISSKSATVSIPIMREDLEGSFMIGSARSWKSKRESVSHCP